MPITKITNIGENLSGHGSRAAHLQNALAYIMKPEKTSNYLWVGSNCGSDPKECLERMMETKRFFDKESGRQGYHVVISFKPGEGDEETAFKLGKEFCERFLGNDFEYAFAVHNDREHLHIHIVFNSVNRISSYKYRYNTGDWERLMQPITDELCRKYSLSVLEYEKEAPRVGESYAKHMAEKDGRMTWADIIRRDIDFAITQTDDEKSFFDFMRSMGYQVRIGNSRNYGEYVAYTAPGESDRNRDRTHRDYKLGAGYRLSEIRQRLKAEDKTLPKEPEPFASEAFRLGDLTYSAPGRPLHRFQILALRRLWMTDNFHFLDLKEKEQGSVRKDLLNLEKLTEQCDYIMRHGISRKADAEERLSEVRTLLRREKKKDTQNKELISDLMIEKRILMRIIKGYDDFSYAEDRPFREDINYEKALEKIAEPEMNGSKQDDIIHNDKKDRVITNG